MKRIISLLLSIILIVCLSVFLFSCGNTTETESIDDDNEKIESTENIEVEENENELEKSEDESVSDIPIEDNQVETKEDAKEVEIAENSDNDYEKENKKLIKSMTKVDDNGTILEYIEYDKNGNETTNIEYYYTGEFKEEYVTVYDNENRIASEARYLEDGTLFTKNEYTYDEYGNVLTDIASSDSDSDYAKNMSNFTTFYEYTYDDEGYILTERDYTNNNTTSGVTKYTYDENHNILIEGIYYNDEIGIKTEYAYDNNGNMLSELYYNFSSSDAPFSLIEYTYDENNNMISQIEYREEDVYTKNTAYEDITYKYNKNNNLTDKVSNTPFTGHLEEHYTYDENGEITAETYIDTSAAGGDGFYKRTYKNTYDENSNLIYQECSFDNNKINYTYTYEYYN